MNENYNLESLLHIFPGEIKKALCPILAEEAATEIRLRIGMPLIVRTDCREIMVHRQKEILMVTKEDILHILQKISQYSLFAYKEEFSQGFITLEGGHRIGICGKAYFDASDQRQLKNISSMNVRIARQIEGCANEVFPYLTEEDTFYHTLLISPPGHGKTTYLRDIIRLASDGSDGFHGKNVAVVDERSEIGNRSNQSNGFYLGKRTDLLDHCPKPEGMRMLLRTMGPDIIAADEIGSLEDMDAFRFTRNCGCKLLMTIHGKNLEDIQKHPYLGEYLKEFPFERYVVIHRNKDGSRTLNVYDSEGNEIWNGSSVRLVS